MASLDLRVSREVICSSCDLFVIFLKLTYIGEKRGDIPTPRQEALQAPWLPVPQTGSPLLNSYPCSSGLNNKEKEQ